MSDERSPAIERLFAAAERELVDEAFVAEVMTKARRRSTRKLLIVLGACLVAAPATWLVAGPLNDVLLELTQLISQPIAGSGDGISSPAVLPMNSVGGALALALLALRAITRRLFSARD